MKHTFKLFAVIAAASTLFSCNLLDVENKSSIYGDGYWTSKGSVDNYVVGIYTQLRSTCNNTLHLEDRGDSFIGIGAGSNPFNHVLTSQTGYGWDSYYTIIQNCNMVIKYAPTVQFNVVSQRDDIMAQAYAIRAYMYFYVVRVWGDAPLELEPTERADKPKLGRSPATEVLQQAIDDAKTAIELFSSDYPEGKGKASKNGTYALLADMYLWKAKVFGGNDQDLNDVITYADLASKGASLEEDFKDIYGTKKGKEVIWAIHFQYPEKVGHYSHTLKPKTATVEKALNVNDIPHSTAGDLIYGPSNEVISMLNRYPGDVRAAASYIAGYAADGSLMNYYDNKMNGTKTETNRVFDNDIIIYRYAEMIMFKAEAYAALGKTTEAIQQLNLIRNRAKIGDYKGALDKLSVEKEILEERGREFYLELKRWPDLLRFYFEGVIDVYQVVPNLKKRLDGGVRVPLFMDVPLTDLMLNPNLTHTAGYENL